MILPHADLVLFYKLLWGLLYYVYRTQGYKPRVGSPIELADLPTELRQEARHALWDDPSLVDAYVRENPDQLDASEIEIALKWRGPIKGDFFIDRFLKRHTILHASDGAVYGIVSNGTEIRDLLGDPPLPTWVRMVLLPFKGRIVYDDVIEFRSIRFGGNYRRMLHERYMAAKQNGRIVTTLEPEQAQASPPSPPKSARDWSAELAEIVTQSAKIRGGGPIRSPAYAALRASADLAQAVAAEPPDLDRIKRALSKARSALTRASNAVRRAEGSRQLR